MRLGNGPRVVVKTTCHDCRHCDGVPYLRQSDSGVDYSCIEPTIGRREISGARTPPWCPLLDEGFNPIAFVGAVVLWLRWVLDEDERRALAEFRAAYLGYYDPPGINSGNWWYRWDRLSSAAARLRRKGK